MDLKELIEKVINNFNSKNSDFEPFIRHIRFPKYKNFVSGTKIDFTFPITVLVGENGCNKSSVIRALYGAPTNKSLGEYWFESKIDTIKEDKNARSCFIYGYFNPFANKSVEDLKTRVYKENDPDYWEPSRPISRYGMEKIDYKNELTKEERRYRSKTRWNAINKEVIYLDFRHEALSAYDKFFYCTSLNSLSSAFKSKKDFIRRYSKNIRKAIDENLSDYSIYQNKRIIENKVLNPRAVACVSNILGKKYSSIRIITHTFYTSEPAKTILLSSDNCDSYSEAFAGTGEFSIVCLVDAVLDASAKSLVLLDEPEVSIHPYAQQKLMEFLLQQILSKKFQIVIATHSPYITKNLPQGAVKLLISDKNGNTYVRNNILPSEVFIEIGASKSQLTILVEDVCAKILLEACLKNTGKQKFFKVCSAERFGAEGILNHDAVTDFIEGAKDVVYCLDGDKRKEFPEITKELNELEESVQIIAPGARLTQKNASTESKIKKYSDFLRHLKSRLYYFPDEFGPEEIIWSLLPEDNKVGIDLNKFGKDKYKEAIRQACFNHFGDDNSQKISSYIEFNAAYILKDGHKTKYDLALTELVEKLSKAFNNIFD